MRCCTFALLTIFAIDACIAADFGGHYQDPVQQASQKGDFRDRAGPGGDDLGPAQMRETGFYQAGPRTGSFEGPSGGVGVRGGGITLPEIKLSLPTLELPSLFRSSHGAKMKYKGGEAPWVSTGFKAVGAAGANGRGADESNNRGTDEDNNSRSRGSSDDCLDLRNQQQEYQRKLEELDRKLEQYNKMSQILEDNIRNQAASSAPAPNSYGHIGNQRPLAATSSRRQMRLPTTSHMPIQPAAHWTTSAPPEPRLLERLPRDTMSRLPYPTTGR